MQVSQVSLYTVLWFTVWSCVRTQAAFLWEETNLGDFLQTCP